MPELLRMRRTGYMPRSRLPSLDCAVKVIFHGPFKAPQVFESQPRKQKSKSSNTLKQKIERSTFQG